MSNEAEGWKKIMVVCEKLGDAFREGPESFIALAQAATEAARLSGADWFNGTSRVDHLVAALASEAKEVLAEADPATLKAFRERVAWVFQGEAFDVQDDESHLIARSASRDVQVHEHKSDGYAYANIGLGGAYGDDVKSAVEKAEADHFEALIKGLELARARHDTATVAERLDAAARGRAATPKEGKDEGQ